MTDYIADFELKEEEYNALLELNVVGALWGNITGNIENQKDLQEALNNKADVNYVDNIQSVLNDSIVAVSDDIKEEAATRAENDTLLQNNINTLSDSLTTEINERVTADTTLQSNINSLTDTLKVNYDTLDDKINNVNDSLSDSITALDSVVSSNFTTLSDSITAIDNTINNYGDIVKYNAADFATKNQGLLAESALQPKSNISELTNNIGYITAASLNGYATETFVTSQGYITEITATDVTNALGYTPYNSSNPNGYITAAALPTVNNPTITIQRNNTAIDSFTLNQADNKEINIIVPTQASDIGALSNTTTINDLTTPEQQNAINSGANVTNIEQITINSNDISDIKSLIPIEATSDNKLADKNFVNSSISTNTAYFIGTFDSLDDLEAYTGTLTNNDYAFVIKVDSAGNTLYDRYKWNGTEWLFEYELNNSSFTAAQWASINSGITNSDVTQIGANTSNIALKQDIINDLTDIRAGAALGATALQDGADISRLTNNTGYITGITTSDVTTALGYTPYNATNPNGYTSNIGTVTSVNNTNPDVNGNVTITIPDSATWGNITGDIENQTDLINKFNTKVDKVEGKSLSTNDFSNFYRNALELIPFEYVSEDKFDDQIRTKQDILTAGTGIIIENNTISSTVTGATITYWGDTD